MSNESILSDELLAELGNDPNAVIVGKKRKQPISEEEKKKKYIPEDELKKFKKLSKKEQKRVIQKNKKIERASKQGEYMDIIKANEISDQQRDMLLSSRQLNHTATLREQLTLLLKKERAGLKLTEAEMNVLYPNRNNNNNMMDEDDDDDCNANKSEEDDHDEEPDFSTMVSPKPTTVEASAASADTLFYFSSLFTAKTKTTAKDNSDDDSSDNGKQEKEKKKKRKKTHQDTSTQQHHLPQAIEDNIIQTSVSGNSNSESTVKVEEKTISTATVTEKKPFSAAGLGKNLLAQFSKIKESKGSLEDEANKDKAKNGKVSTIFSSEFDYNAANDPLKPTFSSSLPASNLTPATLQALQEEKLTKTQAEDNEKALAKALLAENQFYNDRKNMPITRPHAVAIDRMNLPVCQMEQEIVEAIQQHDVIILCGETGSGKSTQVPQFLYEAGYAQDETHLIGIAQPRRVAVTSTAERVNFEMGCTLPALQKAKKWKKHVKNQRKQKEKAKKQAKTIARRDKNEENTSDNSESEGGEKDDIEQEEEEESEEEGLEEEKQIRQFYPNGRLVGYQIRYDASTVGSDTRIKFMTDGILLREISQDLLLRKYSVIILDEAHERNVNTDILLGLLSRAIPLRKDIAAQEMRKWTQLSDSEKASFTTPLTPLKVIIMSATLRVDDFQQTRLFQPLPPVIKVDARQYPVTNHFAKRTETKNYLQESFKKTCQIHERLPPGGILLFLTGKREILYMCQRLQRALAPKKQYKRLPTDRNTTVTADDNDKNASDNGTTKEEKDRRSEEEEEEALIAGVLDNDQVEDIDVEDGEDDYDALYWDKGLRDDPKKQSKGDGSGDDSQNPSDEESELSDIEDEDYVKPTKHSSHTTTNVQKSTTASETKMIMSESEDENDEEEKKAAKMRQEMLAKILGKPVSSANTNNTEEEKPVLANNPTNTTDNNDTANNNTTVNNETTNTDANTNTNTNTIAEPIKLKPWILPLYAMMPTHLQKKVFAKVPDGHRLIVIATNVAETSITIPGIRYVVDSGRGKEKVLASSSTNASNATNNNGHVDESESNIYGAGITRYEVKWISRASSDQRAGRAGRTGPGHCYRLYSSNFYQEHMVSFMPPEINVTPLEDIVLHMLSLGISEIDSFPFPSNPPRAAVTAAVTLLTHLGAISSLHHSMSSIKEREAKLWSFLNHQSQKLVTNDTADSSNNTNTTTNSNSMSMVLGHLTPLGKMLRWFPIHPRFATMLVVATQTSQNMGKTGNSDTDSNNHDAKIRLISFVLTMVATLTERSVFVFDDDQHKDSDSDHDADSDSDSDSDDGDNNNNRSQKKRKLNAKNANKTNNNDSAKSEEKRKRKAEERKLFFHASGDVMARLRATGAYLYTLYTALDKLRRQKYQQLLLKLQEEKETQAKIAQETAANNAAITNKEGEEEKEEDAELLLQEQAQKLQEYLQKPFQKHEFDAANADDSVIAFCQRYRLHQGTLQRILDLRNQLQHIVESLYPRLTNHNSTLASSNNIGNHSNGTNNKIITFPAILDPPTIAEETALRQILLAGYCDQIAKRAPFTSIETHLQRLQQLQSSSSANATAAPGAGAGPGGNKPVNYLSRRRKFTAYLSGHPALQATGPLYVHPTSNMYAHDISLASETLPEYILYTNIMKNARGDCLYLSNVTVIQPQWIATVALTTCPLISIKQQDIVTQLEAVSSHINVGNNKLHNAKNERNQKKKEKKRSHHSAFDSDKDNSGSDDSDSDSDSDSSDINTTNNTNSYHSSSSRTNRAIPYYDLAQEAMVLFVKPRYGVHLWSLPAIKVSLSYVLKHWQTDHQTVATNSAITNKNSGGSSNSSNSLMPLGYRTEDLEYRWFARCLLLGQIPLPLPVPQLHRSHLADIHCITQLKPHVKMLPLLRALMQKHICNRTSLLHTLAQTPQYLGKEMESLLHQDVQRAFRVQWLRLSQLIAQTNNNSSNNSGSANSGNNFSANNTSITKNNSSKSASNYTITGSTNSGSKYIANNSSNSSDKKKKKDVLAKRF